MVGKKNIIFCYDAEKHTRKDNESKQHFLKHKGKTVITKKSTLKDQRGKEVGFAAILEDIRGLIHPHS